VQTFTVFLTGPACAVTATPSEPADADARAGPAETEPPTSLEPWPKGGNRRGWAVSLEDRR